MKRIKLIMLCLITAVTVNAQGIGVKAGINLARVEEDPEDLLIKYNMGFHLGVVYEVELKESLFFIPGLVFTQKGGKTSSIEMWEDFSEEEPILFKMKMKVVYNYLEAPLNFAYKEDLGGVKLVIEGGPYLGYALSGKIKSEGEMDGLSFNMDENINFNSEEGFGKRFDYGINAGLGVEYQLFKLSVHYGLGLANLEDYHKEVSSKNRVIGFSVGYFLNK